MTANVKEEKNETCANAHVGDSFSEILATYENRFM